MPPKLPQWDPLVGQADERVAAFPLQMRRWLMRSNDAIALLSGGRVFEQSALFELTDDDVDSLLREGRISLNSTFLRFGVCDDKRPIVDGALCLAIRESWSDNPPPFAREFTVLPKGWRVDNQSMGGRDDPEGHGRNMWLTLLEVDGPALSLLDRRSVSQLLSEIPELTNDKPRDSEEGLKDLEQGVIPEALAEANASGTYSGAWSICSCGEWGDGATFLWMRDHRQLLRVVTDSCELWSVELLPRNGRSAKTSVEAPA